jgi:hypothetical protein
MKVWVIGAGFSRRLGGPLLGDLISETALKILRHRHPGTWLDGSHLDQAIQTFLAGASRGMWRDAEEYMAALASGDSTWIARIAELLRAGMTAEAYLTLSTPSEYSSHMSPEDVVVDACWFGATQLVAAQCADFVERSQSDPEGWLPYDRWANAISSDDVIVSFNYDDVVERVMARNKRPLWVPNPRMPSLGSASKGELSLLKLHGSVTFRDTILHPREPDTVANLDRNPAFIATPGRGKRDDCLASYLELWQAASKAIASCDSLSVLGYRCPPTDEMAKAMLVDSLARRNSKPNIDLVLGDDRQATARLAALLRGHARVRNTRLFAQDYLSVFGAGTSWQNTDVFASMFPGESIPPGLVRD